MRKLALISALVAISIAPHSWASEAPSSGTMISPDYFSVNASRAGTTEARPRHPFESLLSEFAVAPALVSGTFQQEIDHSGKLPGATFTQRYWVNSAYASAGDSAPVILHICGEGNAEDGYFLHDNALEWAKALGAHVVYLEHRYYGESLPFSDLSTEHLQYLSLDNVIEDLASFQRAIAQQRGWKGKWISVGGSYSGTLSAIYRQKHPELVVGALASSAPMVSGKDRLMNDAGDLNDISSSDPARGGDERPWVYQSCTTFGFWVAEGMATYEPSSALCQEIFGAGISHVDHSAYNQSYYAPFISNAKGSPSNILFTYGSEDVWTQIGLAPNDNQNGEIEIRMIPGAGHHFDLNAPSFMDNASVLAARAEFLKLARVWLSR